MQTLVPAAWLTLLAALFFYTRPIGEELDFVRGTLSGVSAICAVLLWLDVLRV